MWLNESCSKDRKVRKRLMYFLLKTLRKRGFLSITTFQICFQKIKQLRSPRKPGVGGGGRGGSATDTVHLLYFTFIPMGKFSLELCDFRITRNLQGHSSPKMGPQFSTGTFLPVSGQLVGQSVRRAKCVPPESANRMLQGNTQRANKQESYSCLK